MEHWEYDVLNVYNWKKQGKLNHYFRALEARLDLEGDVCEAGVYQGRSLLATALFLKEKGSEKIVYGFDTFTGFPPKTKEDSAEIFSDWFKEGKIPLDHYENVVKLREYRKGKPLSLNGNFHDANVDDIHRRAKLLGLDNYRLLPGDFKFTMRWDFLFMAGLIDCDLYQSYKTALPFIWERMVPGSYLFLDEYYSLKFPGARQACDEFFPSDLLQMDREPNDFERWHAEKPLHNR